MPHWISVLGHYLWKKGVGLKKVAVACVFNGSKPREMGYIGWRYDLLLISVVIDRLDWPLGCKCSEPD